MTETVITVIAVGIAGTGSGLWLMAQWIKSYSQRAAKKEAGVISEDVVKVQKELDTAQAALSNLNQAYDKAQKEIDTMKKWYEASINDRKALERDKETLGRDLSVMTSKYYERDKDASVLEQKLENLYKRVESLENESTLWRDKAESAISARDIATGRHLEIKEFIFDLLERVEAKSLVRKWFEEMAATTAVITMDSKGDEAETVVSPSPKSEAKEK